MDVPDFSFSPPEYQLPDVEAEPLDYPWEVPVGEGWHPDASMEEYLGWPILSNSLAFLVTHHGDRTPRYLRWAMLHPPEKSGGGSDAAQLGTLAHSILLEPETLEAEYVVEPEPDPNVYTKADGSPAKNVRVTGAWIDMIEALEKTGKIIVKREQYENAIQMRDSVMAHPKARGIIEADGLVEASAVVRDPATGLLLKIRVDKAIPALGWNVNVKSAYNANRETFMRSAYNFGYYIGAAFYERALRALGFDHRRSVFLVIESGGSNDVAVWEADAGFMDAGHQVLDRVLPMVAECVEKDDWPGLPLDIDYISLPHWAWSRVEAFVSGY